MSASIENWLSRKLVILTALVTLALNLIAIGAIYAKMDSRLEVSSEKIKQLEDMRADETRWLVAQHDKRLDAHEQVLTKLMEQLTKSNLLLERIDQRTGGKVITKVADDEEWTR